MLTELKAFAATLKGALILAAVAVLLVAGGVLWWKLRSGATAKADLQVARQVISTERQVLKITSQIDMRVNAESIQTAQTAEAATDEIARIRQTHPAVVRHPDPSTGGAVAPAAGNLSADDARVVQLAREARAAAVASAARLQSARTGAR